MSVASYVKNHKLVVVLAVALLYLVGRDFLGYFFGVNVFSGSKALPRTFESYDAAMPDIGMSKSVSSIAMPTYPTREAAPTEITNRMVIQDTSLSLVVKTVDDTINQIEAIAKTAGGYMVQSSLSKPEGAASGNIILRVPSAKRAETLQNIKNLGTKVVSETVYGTDVTDQYADLQTRLDNLMATKAKYQTVLDQAASVPQIMEVTREIQNLQTQIDNLKGQQNYLSKTAELTKISVNLSTDELALPYAPDKSWRPEAVFKQAVRSLVGTLRGIGSLLIWLVVYSPIWLIGLVGWMVYRRFYVNKN